MTFKTIATSLLTLLTLAVLSACASNATPTPTPAPAAGVVLQQILTDCWGVTQLKELDGTRADHVRAFECARARLLDMARDYPEAAEPHRLLAWGYLYALADEAAASAEYERAAAIYQQHDRRADQSEMLIRLATLALQHDHQSGCALLTQASAADPKNTRAPLLLQNFGCGNTPPLILTPTRPAP